MVAGNRTSGNATLTPGTARMASTASSLRSGAPASRGFATDDTSPAIMFSRSRPAGVTSMVVNRSFFLISSVTFFCIPTPKLIIDTRAPMPTMTPSVVSTVRSLVLHRFALARR
jgi:hypothetical protein